MTTFGEKLRELRIEAGLSQQRLAELTGLAPVTLYGYERGVVVPEVPSLQRLARALGVPLSVLAECKFPPSRSSRRASAAR